MTNRSAMTAVAALGAAGLVAIAAAQRRGRFRDVDRRVRRWFRRRRESGEPIERVLAKLGTSSATWFAHVPAALFAGGWLSTKSGFPAGAALPAASIASTVLPKGLKTGFDRPRPRHARREGERGNSFPSGHAASTTAIGLTAAYALLREHLAKPAAVLPAALAWVALSSAAKLYDEDHGLSDVLGGIAGGLAIGGATSAAYECSRHRRDEDGEAARLQESPGTRHPAPGGNGAVPIVRAAGRGLIASW